MTALGLGLIALGLGGAFVGRTPLGALNFVLLQWFAVRLARRRWREFNTGRDGITHHVGWRIERWVLPLTGWFGPYRYIKRTGMTS